MRTFVRSIVIGLTLAAAANQAHAQGFAGGIDLNDPDTQEMIGMWTQTMQRIQESGIDLQAIGAQVQAGTFDAAGFQQMLMDKGIIDGTMMDRMQKTGQKMVSKVLKGLLNSTDEEWAILSPKVEKVIAAGTVAQRPGSMQFGMGNVRNVTTVSKAMDALKAELNETGTTEGKLAGKLKEWRDARAQAEAELKRVRDDLRSVLTLRQEAILMNFGLLD